MALTAQSFLQWGTEQVKPFLLRFAVARPPVRAEQRSDYFYDDAVDMVRWRGGQGEPLAIDSHGETGPMTKKKDIEKGEDQKDRRMWE